jgi:hypothetical protein
MAMTTTDRSFCVSFFKNPGEAEQALQRLQAAGFSKTELAIICPENVRGKLGVDVPQAQRPGSHAAKGIVEGGAIGAALGGIGLVAAALVTGGAGAIAALPVLIGGGALAGGFAGLILTDGYGKEIGSYYEEAIRLGDIVVGVAVQGEDRGTKLDVAERLMSESGGKTPADMAK